VIRNRALGLRVEQQPAVNSTEGLIILECMLQMLAVVYASIAELDAESQTCAWSSGFLEGIRYQLKRMLQVLFEYLKTSRTPRRLWVRASSSYVHSFKSSPIFLRASHDMQLACSQGYQQLTRWKLKQSSQPQAFERPTDEGVFAFLVLIVHGWYSLLRGEIQLPSSTPEVLALRSKNHSENHPAGENSIATEVTPELERIRPDGSSSSSPFVTDSAAAPTARSNSMKPQFQAVQTLLTEFFSLYPEV
jgi:hypothetical protein